MTATVKTKHTFVLSIDYSADNLLKSIEQLMHGAIYVLTGNCGNASFVKTNR